MIVRITRHGDPIDTMSLACDDCLSMADPPMATAAPAVTAKPAPSAARRGTSRRHWRPRMSMSAIASPTPTSADVTLTAKPRPTRIPAATALLAGRTTPQDPPHPGGRHPPQTPLGGSFAPPYPPGEDESPKTSLGGSFAPPWPLGPPGPYGPSGLHGPFGPSGPRPEHDGHGGDAEDDRLAVHVRPGHEHLEQQRVAGP